MGVCDTVCSRFVLHAKLWCALSPTRCCVHSDQDIAMTQVMAKVLWPSFLWGVGTAIGELPPYFMARAAKLVRSLPPRCAVGAGVVVHNSVAALPGCRVVKHCVNCKSWRKKKQVTRHSCP